MKEKNQKQISRDLAKQFVQDFKRRYANHLEEIELRAQKGMANYIMKQYPEKVAVYKNDEYEVPTRDLVKILLSQNIQVGLPAVKKPENIMNFYQIKNLSDYDNYNVLSSNQDLIKDANLMNKFDIDLFLIPLLGINLNRQRLGRGMGHYDRTIKRIDNKLFCALLYSYLQVFRFTPDEHDITIPYILILDDVAEKILTEKEKY